MSAIISDGEVSQNGSEMLRRDREIMTGAMRHWVGAFDEFAQAIYHCRSTKQLAENVDFVAKLVMRNRLDEFFCCDPGCSVKFLDLRCRESCDCQCLSRGGHLAD